jgi:hypothetical protein
VRGGALALVANPIEPVARPVHEIFEISDGAVSGYCSGRIGERRRHVAPRGRRTDDAEGGEEYRGAHDAQPETCV